MTDPVWWYVLAGFLFGFILSTLWEWLYFRQRRMRIENRRIAELEATVRSLSVAPRSVENATSPDLAVGYQSPLVFLEGEVEDVDTVEVIVPATPEPVKFDQSTATQPSPALQRPAETQAVMSKGSTSAGVHNGYGVVHEAPDSEPGTSIAVGGETSHRSISPAAKAAAVVAATAAIANDKDQTGEVEVPDLSDAPQPETIPDTPPPVAQVSASMPSASATTPTDASSPAGQEEGTAPGTPDAVRHPAAKAAAVVAATAAIANDKDQTPAVPPPPAVPVSAALVSEPQVQANQAQVPQATAPTTAETGPAAPQATQAPGVQVESEPSSGSSGKKPVRRAVLASALWSKLARTPKAQQQASPTGEAEVPDLSDAPQPETIPDTPPPVAQVSASMPSASATTPGTALETQPGSTTGTAVEPPVEPIVDAGEAQSVANNQQDAALPLSAILPRATKPAPLSKSGQTNRQETQPVTTLAASGLEPKLEQVSNQLGDLAASLSELIEAFDQLFNGQRPGA